MKKEEKNVLFLASDVGIYPLNSGRSQHSYGLCNEISKYVNLHVISPVTEEIDYLEVEEKLKNKMDIRFIRQGNMYFELLFHPLRTIKAYLSGASIPQSRILKETKKIIEKYNVDVVIIDYIRNGMYFSLLKEMFPEVRFYYNSHNAEFVNMEKEYDPKRQNTLWNRILAKCQLNNIINLEKKILLETEKTMSISKDDITLLVNRYGVKQSKFLVSKPLIRFNKVKDEVDLNMFEYKLLIVGTMHWGALVDGIMWFVENVFKELIEKDRRYKLFLVGANPCDSILQLGERYSENIVVTGTVDDVSKYFKMCDISIIPMFEGTGTKLKVLESLCSGIPTISTTLAAKDYDLTNGEVFISNTDIEFLDAIKKISDDPLLRKNLYKRMQKYISNYYSLEESIVNELQN